MSCRIWNYSTIHKRWQIDGKVQGNSVFVNLVNRSHGTQLYTETTSSQTNIAFNKIKSTLSSYWINIIVTATSRQLLVPHAMPYATKYNLAYTHCFVNNLLQFSRKMPHFIVFACPHCHLASFYPFTLLGTLICNLVSAYYIFCILCNFLYISKRLGAIGSIAGGKHAASNKSHENVKWVC